MAARLRFQSLDAELSEAKAVFMGCSFDDSSMGALNAPDALRSFSRKMDDFHLVLGKTLSDLKIHDSGNLELLDKSITKNLDTIYQKAFSFLTEDKFLLSFGERREISYGILKAAKEKHQDLKVIVIDAHHGMETVEGDINDKNYLSYAINDFLQGESVLKMGIREGSKESYDAGIRRHKHLPPRVKKGVMERIPKLYHHPVYLSIDLDVLDPIYAPGVAVPISCGIDVFELIETIRVLQGVHVIGVDICGYVPKRDISEITASVVYRLIKDIFCYFL